MSAALSAVPAAGPTARPAGHRNWETDPVIYSLYADVLAGRISGGDLLRVLDVIPVDRDWRTGGWD